MEIRTTSIHNLNAGKGLKRPQKVFYLLLNWVNNLFPYTNVDSNLQIRDFTCKNIRRHWARLQSTSSPSRKLSDLFWLELPWAKIREELNEINILDTGCGSGNYGQNLMDWSGNNINSYTGVDVSENKNWFGLEERYSNFQFYCCNSSEILRYIPEKINLFISQSAIEHFQEDLRYFEQIRDYIFSYQKSVMQVHLFLSSSCRRLYPWHGVRQYTPRTISKISKLFKDSSYVVLFRLGGKECNRLHYEFITKPIFIEKIGDLRVLKEQEYDRRLLAAMEHDMRYPQRYPAFYALVIHSFWKEKLF